ncbi:hypothetical protein TrCOL_g2549 [Triparma columacea]|uniref:Phospholipid/glycerol acyltransferase domain-containing protein n=1 Tax=Triparma columacea TaxID=722753 RepID=A0A9W7GL30_9STRA|nr:hypothetical protein TrCOL_g2549 [Triparma columacea]
MILHLGFCNWTDSSRARSRIFKFILKVFFRRVDVLNINSLPMEGPLIIYGNHANQFVDAMNLIAKCPRSISFLIAMKSWKRRVIGDAAKLLGAVPVLRPQDIAFKGEGKIVKLEIDEEKGQYWAIGEGTNFTQIDLKKGAKLRAIKGWRGDLVTAEDPISDTKVEMKKFPEATEDTPAPVCTEPVDFKILPKVDQKKVFGDVNALLANNGTIGMFPEGGSHDQGHLLPLKAGITIMALGSAAEGTPVLIIPVGLVYFHAHRFRSKAVVQYGEPFPPPPRLVEMYRGGETRKACGELLEIVTRRLAEVTINTPDFKTNKILQTVRRLYQPDMLKQMTGREFMGYSKKFTTGFERIKETEGAKKVLSEVSEYMEELKRMGIKDKELRLVYRVKKQYGNECMVSMFGYSHLLLFLVTLPLSFPGLLLNTPIMYLSRHLALKQQVRALKASKVKVGAYDVVASEMVKWAGVFVPIFYTIYIIIVAVAADIYMRGKEWKMMRLLTPVLVFVFLPHLSYVSILLSDVWFFSWKKFCAIFRRGGSDFKKMGLRRLELVRRVRKFVEDNLREKTFAVRDYGGEGNSDGEDDSGATGETGETGETGSSGGGGGGNKVFPEDGGAKGGAE